ncbi:MAG: FtsX-like permease family protein [Candidatus Eisenbacteria bacterium]|nr:FtsX-like permease family protein [Candidatus Eisenbacteria bacterium]
MLSLSTLRIAWRNLWRNPKRTVFAVTAITVGQLAFLGTAGLTRGYAEQYFQTATGPMLGHLVVNAEGWRDDRELDNTLSELSAVVGAVRGVDGVERVSPRIYAPAMAAVEREGFMCTVVGVEPDREAWDDGLLSPDEAAELGEGSVLVGRRLAERERVPAGIELAIIGQDVEGSIASDLFIVAGTLGGNVALVNDLGVVMSLSDAQELLRMGDEAHELVVHAERRDALDALADSLRALPELSGARVSTWRDVAPQIAAIIEVMGVSHYFVLIIVFIAAAAGIANTMLMSTFERNREFGMLLSLGCGPGRLSRIVLIEALLIGCIGVVAGTLIGAAAVHVLGETGINYAALVGADEMREGSFAGLEISFLSYPTLRLSDIVGGIGAILGTSVLSVIWPILHVVRLEPVKAMRA